MSLKFASFLNTGMGILQGSWQEFHAQCEDSSNESEAIGTTRQAYNTECQRPSGQPIRPLDTHQTSSTNYREGAKSALIFTSTLRPRSWTQTADL